MTRKERIAVMAVYSRLNKLSGMIPTNPCDMNVLARLSRTCEVWIPRCMNALSETMDGLQEDALDTMEVPNEKKKDD